MKTSNQQTTKTGRFRARVAGMTFLAVIWFNAVGGMSASGGEAVTDRAADRLSAEAFAEPPLNARPGSFWDWLNGSITKEQITRDLTAMKEAGMRGAEIWDVAAYADPDGRVPAGPPFLGPDSTRLIVHAIHEADRLGLEIGLVASSGWNAGGSWIPPEHAGKGLYHSATAVTGPKKVQLELPLPDVPKECPRDAGGRPVYLREVAVLAVPRHPSEVLAKIHALASEGATVVGHQRPTRSPGLKDQESETAQVLRLAGELWGQAEMPAKQATSDVLIRPIGKGRFIAARDRTAALRKIGVAPDFEIAGHDKADLGPLDFVHRKTTGEDFYFIYNKTAQPQALTCRFRAATGSNGRAPEFWWPESGRRSSCADWRSLADGRTEVPVALAPSGSVFVVFRKPDAALDPIARDSFVAAASPAPMLLEGPWHVAFPEGWGAPRQATFEQLQSWTQSDNEGIRSFSGIATYRKSIEIPELLAKQGRLFLELGDLGEIAEITLNGKNLGRVWLPPYRVEISGVAQAGPNQLEIRIANLWANRFNADSLRPGPERFTRSNLDRLQTDPTSDSSFGQVPRGKTRPVHTKLPPLMKSGLFGPVRILSPERRKREGG